MTTGKTIDRRALHIEFALGIIAGEGSFYMTFAKDDRRRYGVTPGIRFQLSMGQFSESLLDWLADVIEIGTVTSRVDGYAWTISSRRDCHALRTQIDRHVANYESGFTETPKYDAYERWQSALDIMRPKAQLTKADLLELAEIRGDINRVDNTNARTTQEITRIIEQADGR